MIIHKLKKPEICVICSVVRSSPNPSVFSIFRIFEVASHRRITMLVVSVLVGIEAGICITITEFVWTQFKNNATNIVTLQAQKKERRYFHNQLIENCACARSEQLSKTLPLEDKSLYISGSEVSLSCGFGSRQEECVWCTSFFTVPSLQNDTTARLSCRIQEFSNS